MLELKILMRRIVLFPAIILLAAFVTVHPARTKDFKPVFGKWKGTLTYLDFRSGKPYSMPANITIKKTPKLADCIEFIFEYPDEPKANGRDTLVISNNGWQIDGAELIARRKLESGGREIITVEKGIDGNDNKRAVLRHIYTIGPAYFIKRKEIKFEGEQNFIMRNEFKMTERIQ